MSQDERADFQQQQAEERRQQEEAALRESLAQSAYDDYYNRRERIRKESIDHSAWLYGASERPTYSKTEEKK